MELDIKTDSKGSKILYYESSNDEVVKVNDGVLTAVKVGSTEVKIKSVSRKEKIINIIVTDLITTPIYAQEKDELPGKKYNNEEVKMLDEILKINIQNAGYGTRAGVIEAARFLALRFPYKIN